MSSKGDEARAELVLSNRSEQIGGAAVANLFVFGMAVFLGGLCWLAARVVLWAAETKAEYSEFLWRFLTRSRPNGSRPTGRRETDDRKSVSWHPQVRGIEASSLSPVRRNYRVPETAG
jgi:hypothetical protein